MTTNQSRYPIWTREEDNTFENGLALYGNIDQWEKIAALIPAKSIEDVKEHYQILVDDIMSIEAGNVPLPDYGSPSEILADLADGSPEDLGREKRSAKSTADRRKAVPWTEEEHRLFLLGMDRLGRGDWRGIGRHFVLTRTPTQVASHAQKYFKRMELGNEKKRPTIHDVLVDGGSISGGQNRIIEGESSQFQMTDICMHDDNITPAHQGIINTPWMTGIGMHDTHTNYFGIDTLDNKLTPQACYLPTGGIGIGGGATDIFQFDTQGSMSSLQGMIPNAQMTGIGTEAPKNMSVYQGLLLSSERTGIGMAGGPTEVFQFNALGSFSSLQGAIGIPTSQGPIFSTEGTGIMGGDATEFFQFDPLRNLSTFQGAIGTGIEGPKNMPLSQGPTISAEMTGIGIGGDATDFCQFDPIGGLRSLQGALRIDIEGPKNMPISQGYALSAEMSGVGVDTPPIMHQLSRSAQTYGFTEMDVGGGVSVQQMPLNAQSASLAPTDSIDDSGSVIPSTDVGIFGFCPTTQHPIN